jgi:hypothetical protein
MSNGSGSNPHLPTDVRGVVHVPYRGMTPAFTDLIGGQVQVLFGAVTSSIEYITAGKLRALALTDQATPPSASTFPTAGEFVPGYEASQWAFGFPRHTHTARHPIATPSRGRPANTAPIECSARRSSRICHSVGRRRL